MASCLGIYSCTAIGKLAYFLAKADYYKRLFYSRYLTDRVAPGNKVTVVGVYSIRKTMKPPKVLLS